eukprot:gene5345-9154_t
MSTHPTTSDLKGNYMPLLKTTLTYSIELLNSIYGNIISEAQLYPTPEITLLPHEKLKAYITKYGTSGLFKGDLLLLLEVYLSKSINSIGSNVHNKLISQNISSTFQNLVSDHFKSLFSIFLVTPLIYPLEVIRTKFIHQNENNQQIGGYWNCIKNSYHNNGFKSFYQGIFFQLVESISFQTTTNFIQSSFNINHDEKSIGNFGKILLANFIATIITYPCSTLKKRSIMQYTVIDNKVVYEPKTDQLYSGILESLTNVFLTSTGVYLLK